MFKVPIRGLPICVSKYMWRFIIHNRIYYKTIYWDSKTDKKYVTRH